MLQCDIAEAGHAARSVARQPIVDAAGRVVGYELLYRSTSTATAAMVTDGDAATTSVTATSLLTIGLETLVGRAVAFLNVSPTFLGSDTWTLFPPRGVVLEVVEDMEPTADIRAALERAVAAGYAVALDDYTPGGRHEPLLDLATVVKLEVNGIDDAELRRRVRAVRAARPGAVLLAEKVEDDTMAARCVEVGFDLFQGYLLGRPETITRGAVPAGFIAAVELMQYLCDPRCDLREVERRVGRDAALAYRVMRIAGSGAFGQRRVGSVRAAVVAMGLDGLRRLLLLIAMAENAAASEALLASAALRAHLAWSLAGLSVPALADRAFTAGLLTVADALFGASMEEVIKPLRLEADVEQVLTTGGGPLQPPLAAALDIEQGRPLPAWCDPAEGAALYLASLRWADEAVRATAPKAARNRTVRIG